MLTTASLRGALTRRRRLAIVLLSVGLAIVAVTFVIRLAFVAAAYKAKMVCSEVFVAGRAPRRVLDDLERDDLALLHYVGATVHDRPAAVSASTLGVIEERATYDPQTGCTLVHGGSPVPAAANAANVGSPGPEPRDASVHTAGAKLRRAIDAAFIEQDPAHPKRTLAVVVMRRGEMVAERYAPGITPSTPLIGWSMTKSVMNALVGVLVGEGRLSLSMRAPVPEWQAMGDPRSQITIDQLLRMSSGLHFTEESLNPLNDAIRMLLRERDTGAYAARQHLDASPGTTWHYSSGTTNILSRIVRRAFANDAAYLRFPRRVLFEPLGMRHALLEADASGTLIGSSFMYATAREWATFGTLYLQDGVWEGRRILPEGWVAYTRTPAPADAQHHYGAHVWLDVPEGYRRGVDDLPGDAFHAAGHEGQFVTVVPSHGLVIVRLGRTRYSGAWDQVRFVHDVLAATAAP